ncbi:hypothetical protein ACOTWR_02870 [Aliarcobacter butzleri]|uniref:hypothetical protein n=1 Tax=Aliarcobacter butzleri TaxID=28197 RepID=UPI0021B44DE0|nr:hypothetical protein [Aliarcobacter butzleri]MCT7598013.1 hypothetical protein [Aliarcobacter butzleri]
MEQILKTQEELNLVKLYKLKKEVYNDSFKKFTNIFGKIKNINFGIDIKYEDIDFSTIIINKNIDDLVFQENIHSTINSLNSSNDILNLILDELVQIITTCKDYSLLSKQNKNSIKEAYFFARYIQILCTTNIHETYLKSCLKTNSLIDKEIETNIWLSFKIYIKNLFKNKINK